jgi:hypothetical protein
MIASIPPGFSLSFTQTIYEIKNNLSYGWLAYNATVDDDIAEAFKDKNILIDNSLIAQTGDFVAHARSIEGSAGRSFKEDRERFATVREEPWFCLLASLRPSLAHGTDGVCRKIYTDVHGQISFKRLLDNKEFVIPKSFEGAPIDANSFGGLVSVIDLFTHAILCSERNLSR